MRKSRICRFSSKLRRPRFDFAFVSPVLVYRLDSTGPSIENEAPGTLEIKESARDPY
jgi:hypothetical protein